MHPRRGRRYSLFPPCRHLPRKVFESTLVTTDSYHLLPTSQAPDLRSINLHTGTANHSTRSPLHNTRLVMDQYGRPSLTPHGMGRASSDFRTFDTPVNRHQRRAAGKWLITQPKTRPSYLPWVTYSNTDILQAPGTVVLCCPADLFSYSATARYVIPEYGQENMFRLKPSVGTAVRLDRSPTAPWNNQIFLLCTRDSNKHPLLHETLHACLTHLL